MAKDKKKPDEASNTFHSIMAASVKGNPKPNKNKTMSTIQLNVLGKTCTFNYSITKTSDKQKIDRYWTFNVTHNHEDLPQIPKSFSFRHDTFHNVTEGKIGTMVEYVSEQIMMKELK
ncbi:hypothetical protein ESA94_00020 [Lacibacter luteus]|uniref:Uncharacterized protein n=1 Tax=Lacibacter luteus TaxID=2508719 RepID=A0A4Q1CLD8_9BACT|nr:hypothetical protein [Lacibacter luteus]RXK61441.1 hypothetical protein ESA94_00020 [Lacibacter luteus]